MKLPKSIKKYIRYRKSIIKKELFNKKDQEELIKILYQKFIKTKKK